MGEIYVCRHGQTDMNVKGCLQGRSDTALNETGREQARGAAEYLRTNGILIDEVYTSPLSRAVETAEIITGIPRRSFTIEHALIERSFGDWEGVALQDIPAKEKDEFFNSPDVFNAPNGESVREIIDRIGVFTISLKSMRPARYGNVLLSTHGAAMHALKCFVYGLPASAFWSFTIKNCEVMKLDLKRMTLVTVFPGYMGAGKTG